MDGEKEKIVDNQEQHEDLAKPKLIGGIPLNFDEISKSPGGEVEVEGVSGQRIKVRVKDNNIHILSLRNEASFNAEIKTGEDGKYYLSFAIFTKEPETNKPNPDFYAGRLADAAIDYFGKKHEIAGILIEWQPGSDNYEKYFQLKKQFLAEEPEEQAKQKAALGTWEGSRIAQPHGFIRVEIEEQKEKIERDQRLGEGEKPGIILRGKFYK